jgi:hypothetical protein
VYVRVSIQEQVEGTSLDVQRVTCRSHVEWSSVSAQEPSQNSPGLPVSLEIARENSEGWLLTQRTRNTLARCLHAAAEAGGPGATWASVTHLSQHRSADRARTSPARSANQDVLGLCRADACVVLGVKAS